MFRISNVLLIILFSIFLSVASISCRETTEEEATKDVVENLDNVMQQAENDVKEVIIKDSSIILKKTIMEMDTIQKNIKN